MRAERTKVLVEIALSVALAAWLALHKVTLPLNVAGGSVSLSMLPIFVIALRRGVVVGVVTGAAFGVVDYFFEPYFVHPIQILLDYGIAFGACGIAGLGTHVVKQSIANGSVSRGALMSVPFVFLGGLGRFVASFVSGIVFFASMAPEGQPVWLYSLTYNISYIAPSTIACAVLTALIVPALERAVPSLPLTSATRA